MTDLTKIPGIGKNMAQRLTRAGYPNIESLNDKTLTSFSRPFFMALPRPEKTMLILR